MARKIVILEDNADRREAMQCCLAARLQEFEASFFDEPAAMVGFLSDHLLDVAVICLDHDLDLKLGPESRLIDPGTGREVADFLAGQTPVCPVVIHTSNSAAAVGMEMVLREARWKTRRVIPCHDVEWIPTQWVR